MNNINFFVFSIFLLIQILVACGKNSVRPSHPRQLHAVPSPHPFSVPLGKRLVVGFDYNCIFNPSELPICWGENGTGNLGDGSTLNRLRPTPVQLPHGVRFQMLAAGVTHTCALTASGVAYCWGENRGGELGVETTGNILTPTQVRMPSGVHFQKLATGDSHTCGLTELGSAYCWGRNLGRLGDGTTQFRIEPTQVQMPSGIHFQDLTAGGVHTCALTVSGAAYCRGHNSDGQLGNGTVEDSLTPSPVRMPSGVHFQKLVAGSEYTCGLTQAGIPYCWGANTLGQLGIGTTQFRLEPTQVQMPSGIHFQELSAGTSHTCGLTPSGVAYCWGENRDGQLGDGTEEDSLTPSPVRMPSGIHFQELATGGSHTCGLTASRVAYCWGENENGQLGDGTTDIHLTPQQVLSP